MSAATALACAAAGVAGAAIGLWTRGVVARHSAAGGAGNAGQAHGAGNAGQAHGAREAERTGKAVGRAGRADGSGGGGTTGEGAGAGGADGPSPEPPRWGRPPAGAVEAVTALVLAALALRAAWPGLPAGAGGTPLGRATELLAFGWLAVVAVALSFVDAATHRLPDRLTLAACLGTAAPLAVSAAVDGRPGDLLGAGLGGVALAGFYLVLFLVNPAGMGLGDVKFAGGLGTALGWLGWDVLVTGAFLGLLAGALHGAVLMALRRAGRKSEIPFGPSMAAGALAAVLGAL
ncbi:prepilin signal peptidase PulO-like enzyme (type II secretory pathway) [Streptosporangium becharense]|uniref:Prepilin signal peptidase PulO-like enzyme (Type II secretory pathway) n=1 Tax=Streptosporangium becharense TaxID=1816182 RepID=A0A7W9ILH5_9ACTN|nr:A24 family peptidase [Streptosporangium becharense]MBB2911666.1 prepilin signal peptidase PulO-like enzyme (type II secretory pathway) [Streptosporangium becharense]MBB5822516.1 prepilin signal peptidase PulO-like enzyme (type II secretory pathway) [Streptosporangium becharense]